MRTGMTLGLALVLLVESAVMGQTWDGGSVTSSNWTDGINWNANVAPINNGSATVTFAGTTRLAPALDVGYDVNGVTFSNGSGAFNIITVNGSILTVRGGGITNNNPNVSDAISAPVLVAAPQAWGGVGGMTFGGAIGLGANTLTINTPSTIGLGNVVGGSGKIVKDGTGLLVLTGSNTFSGGIALDQGTLVVGVDTGLGTGPLMINGGAFQGASGQRVLANAVVVNGDLAIPGGTAVMFTGPITLTGSHTLTNSITNLAMSGAIGSDTGDRELTLSGGGTLALSGSALTLGASLRLDSGTLTATGLINTAGHTLTQNAGTFTGSLINRGTYVYNGGTPTGNLSNEAGGDATLNANLTLSAALNNVGTLRVADSRTLTFGAQHLNNTGTIELAGGTLAANASTAFASSGTISGHGAITTTDTSFVNSGSISVSGGNLSLTSNLSYSSSGTVSIATGRQLQWNSAAAFGNTGLVQLAGGAFAGTGPLTNGAAGEIRGSGSVLVALTNSGLVRAAGGNALAIANLAGNNSGGELRVDDGATMNVQSAFASSGTMVIGGPNATLNLNSVTNTGTLRGQGRVTGAVLNSGVVRAEGGSLTFASAGNTNPAAGRLESATGTQLFYTQGLAANAGLIALTGGAFDNNNVALANSGRIEGYGTLRTGGLTNTGTISVGGSLDVIGAVTNSSTVATTTGSTVRFFGPVSGPGSYTGSGTVVFLNTFSPGASPAAVSFSGDVALEGSSNLVIELGGPAAGSQYDTLAAGGSAALGGALDVDLIGGFVPTVGSEFQIVAAPAGISGKFSSALLPSLTGASWQLNYQPNAVSLRVALAGDFNFSGTVDAADYTLWRDAAGQTGVALAADANNDGQVDAADYAVWKMHFGQSTGGSGGSIRGAVPEPSSAVLLVTLLGLAVIRQRHAVDGRGW